MPNLEDTILLAAKAHYGQRDKSGQPYFLHPLRIMMRMDSDEERMAALLHDVVEDTPWTLEQLEKEGYSQQVVEAVDCLTKREGESYQESVERVAANPIAHKVKLADIEDNMDIRRISEPKERDFKRLKKYHRAWKFLRQV